MVGCDLQRILADAVFRHRCRSKGLCLHSPARRLARPLASATVGAFASAGLGEFRRSGGKRQRRGLRPPPFETTPWGWAIIKSRQSRPEGGFGWQRLTPPGMGTPPAGGTGDPSSVSLRLTPSPQGEGLGLYCALILLPALPKMSFQAPSTLAASSWASWASSSAVTSPSGVWPRISSAT